MDLFTLHAYIHCSKMYNVVKLYMAYSSTKNDVLALRLDAYNGDVDSEDSFIMATINVKV